MVLLYSILFIGVLESLKIVRSLLQGIFPTQELNIGLLHCRQILLLIEPATWEAQDTYLLPKKLLLVGGGWWCNKTVEMIGSFLFSMDRVQMKFLFLMVLGAICKAVTRAVSLFSGIKQFLSWRFKSLLCCLTPVSLKWFSESN